MTRETRHTLDLRDFKGVPGAALLIVAANRHLSVSDLLRLLEAYDIERSRSWVQRRRWLFQGVDNAPGIKRNADGEDNRALAIMRDNPNLSVGKLSWLLKEYGIHRSREWVRQRRCD